jgi:serine protease Do
MKTRYGVLTVALLLSLVTLASCGIPSISLTLPTTGTTPSTNPEAAPVAQQVAQVAQPTQAPAPAVAPNSVLAALQSTLEQIYSQVNPSVVFIQVVQTTASGNFSLPDIPGLPFGNTPQVPQIQQAEGSGFVWDTQGHIVTNNHVIDGASQISVTFYDGTTVSATVVGADADSDLAVLQVNAPANLLQPVQVADSTQVKVGQLSVAIGNPFGLEGTMTVGFVSALGRLLPVSSTADAQGAHYSIPDVIQTDAPINPGNSGGVLVDEQGRLIGVTSAIESSVQSNAGVGFAIPSAIVQKVVPALIQTGHYDHTYLGISGTTLTSDLATAMNLPADQRGALVISVTPGGPADKAGLLGSDRQATVNGQPVTVGGDVITTINGQPIKSIDDVIAYLANSTEVGQQITLTILRNGNQTTVNVTLEARPSSTTTQTTTPSGGTAGNAWLGIVGATLTSDIAQAMNLPSTQTGVLVEQVQAGSPADTAGLRGSFKSVTINGQTQQVGGDIIVAWNGQPITAIEDLQGLVQQAQPGQNVTLTILRDGNQMTVNVTLAQRSTTTP